MLSDPYTFTYSYTHLLYKTIDILRNVPYENDDDYIGKTVPQEHQTHESERRSQTFGTFETYPCLQHTSHSFPKL